MTFPLTFTINIKNTGTMPLYGLVVEENFPDSLEFVSATGNWVYDSKNRLFKLEKALPACEPIDVESFNVTFRAVKGGNVENSVNVTSKDVNGSASDEIYVYDPNFDVKKIVSNRYAAQDEEVYFTILVTNIGNMNLTEIELTELYPNALEFLGFEGNWSTDDNITFKLNGSLPVGNSTELTIIFKAIGKGNATNVVYVTSNETNFNKSANDTVIIDDFNFEVEKLALNGTVTIGDNVVYTIVITNTGNKNLTQIRLKEDYCNGLEFVSINDGWTTDDNKTFNYIGLLKPGENAILNITFKTVAGGNMTNVVTVDSSEVGGMIASNNTTYVVNPEISVEKLSLNKSVDIGDEVHFTIVVTNVGNVDLSNVTLVEGYDSLLEFVKITSQGWITEDNITFVYGEKLAVGDKAILNITFKALDGGNAINIVNVSTNETDGDLAINTSLIKKPDFAVVKLLLNESVKVNDTMVYSIIVTNIGNIDLTNVTVMEEYPDSLEFISNNPEWENIGNRLFKFIGSLAPGDIAILNITFKAIRAGNVTNEAIVTTNETDGNKSATNTTLIKDLSFIVSKVAVSKVVYVGEETTFIIKVTNLGNVDMKGIKVYEDYPSSLKYIYHEGNWDISDFREFTLLSSLAPGESTYLNITFKVLSMENITNPIKVVFEDVNKTANETISALKAEIKVEKISVNRTTYVGNQSCFDIVVTNTGNIDLANVTLLENYPKELIFDSVIGDNWTQSGSEFKYSGILESGKSVKLSVVFNTTKVGVFTNNLDVKASINNLSDISNLTEDLIEKLSNSSFTDNSSNITKVNVIYPEPQNPEPITPDNQNNTDDNRSDKRANNNLDNNNKKDKTKDSRNIDSNGVKSKSQYPLDSKATGNPLMLLALMLITLILPLRRRKR